MKTISINELKQYNCPVNDSHNLNISLIAKNFNHVECTKINQINDFAIHLYNKEKLTQITYDKFSKYNYLQLTCKSFCSTKYLFNIDSQCRLTLIDFNLFINKNIIKINLDHTNNYLYKIFDYADCNNIFNFYKPSASIEDIKSFYDNLIFI